MKCDIIRDLLPAYCDSVCSKEAAREIEEHTAVCADCQKLLDDYRSEISPPVGSPEKPFRRIKRRIFRNKLVISALVIILAAILCTVGYLTYGQIARNFSNPSFETVISNIKAQKIVDRYCKGDIDYVMDHIEIYQTGVALFDNQEEVREHCRNELAKFYGKYLKDRDLNTKFQFTKGYTQFMGENGVLPLTDVTIFDGRSELLTFSVIERTAGKFYMCISGWCSDLGEDCDKNIGTLDLALNPAEPTPVMQTAIINNVTKSTENFGLFANHFGETREERQTLNENAVLLTENMYCESAYYADFRFDSENDRYLIDIGFTFKEKSSGRRAAYSRTVRLKSTQYRFEILPEFELVVIDGGISPENLEKLENLFKI